jgi:hypothetical protein
MSRGLAKAARLLRLRAAVGDEERCLASGGAYFACSRPVHDNEPGGGTHAAHGDSEDVPFATWREGEEAKLTGDGIDYARED